jgi:hypothetical protein
LYFVNIRDIRINYIYDNGASRDKGQAFYRRPNPFAGLFLFGNIISRRGIYYTGVDYGPKRQDGADTKAGVKDIIDSARNELVDGGYYTNRLLRQRDGDYVHGLIIYFFIF